MLWFLSVLCMYLYFSVFKMATDNNNNANERRQKYTLSIVRVFANLWLFCSLKLFRVFFLSLFTLRLLSMQSIFVALRRHLNWYSARARDCICLWHVLFEREQKKSIIETRAQQKIASLLFYFICLFVWFFFFYFLNIQLLVYLCFASHSLVLHWCHLICTSVQNIHNCRHLCIEVKRKKNARNVMQSNEIRIRTGEKTWFFFQFTFFSASLLNNSTMFKPISTNWKTSHG